jgi:hypothetical protein
MNFRLVFTSKLILLLPIFFPPIFFAQEFNFFKKIKPFTVLNNLNVAYEFPFFGGMNTPIPQLLDIDGDGDLDLFLQDQETQLIFLRNTGSAGQFRFTWESDSYQDLSTGAWFKFADADGDGDIDLFAENPFGIIRYYRNSGTPNLPIFENAADTLRDKLQQPIEVEGFSIPEWVDIDCDSDLDLFLGRQNGRITYYQNMGLDSLEIPLFEFVTDTFQGLNIQTGGGIQNSLSISEHSNDLHGANSMTYIDIDNDLDNDLFWGDFFAESIIHFENFGTCEVPGFENNSIIEQYPINAPLTTGGFNVPRFGDIDNDGDYDMMVGVLGGFISFTSNLSIPALVDIDNDSDLDIFIANQEDLSAPDEANSRIYFIENRSNENQISFTLANPNFLNRDRKFDFNYAPSFGDIDGDADQDLFLGKFDGTITFYRNDGNPESPDMIKIDDNYASIDIGTNSSPALTDIDADEDLDLFIGEFNGNINFYRNMGTKDSAIFELDTTHYFGISLGTSEYSHPHFTDIDQDGDDDLFIGTATKGIVFYRNIGSKETANFIRDESLDLVVPPRTAPFFADIDNDGDLDLFSGTSRGGIIYFENQEVVEIIGNPNINSALSKKFQLLGNFPNPFNPYTKIVYQANEKVSITIKIFNILGEEVKTLLNGIQVRGRYEIEWNSQDKNGLSLTSGIYLIRIAGHNTVVSHKMILLK